jgi:hypothetical protein
MELLEYAENCSTNSEYSKNENAVIANIFILVSTGNGVADISAERKGDKYGRGQGTKPDSYEALHNRIAQSSTTYEGG